MLEVESRLIASAMEELAINCIDDLPDESVLPSTLKNATKKEKRAFLEKLSTAAVDNYVLRKEKTDQLLQKTRNAHNYESRERGMSNDGRFKCHFPGCCKTYRFDGKRRRDHEATHGLFLDEDMEMMTKEKQSESDDLFNYQTSLLEIGMVIKNFFDAVNEGDGERIFRSWEFMLIYLKADGGRSKKYALEAFYLVAQFYSLLSERGAYRLIWNRFAKSSDSLGGIFH